MSHLWTYCTLAERPSNSQDFYRPTIMNSPEYALRQELRGHEEDVSSREVLSHAQMVFVANGPLYAA